MSSIRPSFHHKSKFIAIILDGSITNIKLANIAQALIKGRAAGAGTGVPVDLTATEVRAIINVENGATADQTASEILAALLTVDGPGSGIDADLLDSANGAAYLARANHTGTQNLSTIGDVSISVANLNSLDDDINSALHFHDSDRTRSSHTGAEPAAITTTMGSSSSTMTSIGKANVSLQASGTPLAYSVPANSLSAAGKGFRFTAWGTVANGGAITVSWGGTQIFTHTMGSDSIFRIVGFIFSTGVDTQRYMVSEFTDVNADVAHITEGTQAKDDGSAQSISVGAGAVKGLVVEFFN